MNKVALPVLVGAFFVTPILAMVWTSSAEARLVEAETSPDPSAQAAVAAASDESYCTPELKKILRRVLQSCGLDSSAGGRGCQPLEAKSVAALSGGDFNALFDPLSDRAGIVQFDLDSDALDGSDQALLEKLFADQRGASWFFVVARSSPEGSSEHNRELSQRRGNAVLTHLETAFENPELDQQVGLLQLGEEFAQLSQNYCTWTRSGDPASCTDADLNRSAFVAWIDCRL